MISAQETLDNIRAINKHIHDLGVQRRELEHQLNDLRNEVFNLEREKTNLYENIWNECENDGKPDN